MSSVLRVRGVVLPEGEHRDLYVDGGTITYDAVDADVAAEGWIVPGLVDAHCHVGLDANGAVDENIQEEQITLIATPEHCSCATAVPQPTLGGSTTARTCRG